MVLNYGCGWRLSGHVYLNDWKMTIRTWRILNLSFTNSFTMCNDYLQRTRKFCGDRSALLAHMVSHAASAVTTTNISIL